MSPVKTFEILLSSGSTITVEAFEVAVDFGVLKIYKTVKDWRTEVPVVVKLYAPGEWRTIGLVVG